MDIEVVNQRLSQLIGKSEEDFLSKLSGSDLNNPATLLEQQFSMQQYSIFVNYQSAVMKAVKDMLSGIIQRI